MEMGCENEGFAPLNKTNAPKPLEDNVVCSERIIMRGSAAQGMEEGTTSCEEQRMQTKG